MEDEKDWVEAALEEMGRDDPSEIVSLSPSLQELQKQAQLIEEEYLLQRRHLYPKRGDAVSFRRPPSEFALRKWPGLGELLQSQDAKVALVIGDLVARRRALIKG